MHMSLTGYHRQGFLAVQYAVDMALITEHNATVTSELSGIDISLQRHPYPPYTEDQFVQVLGSQLPLLLMFNMFLVVPSLVKDICLEKERKQKVSGISHSVIWGAGGNAMAYVPNHKLNRGVMCNSEDSYFG